MSDYKEREVLEEQCQLFTVPTPSLCIAIHRHVCIWASFFSVLCICAFVLITSGLLASFSASIGFQLVLFKYCFFSASPLDFAALFYFMYYLYSFSPFHFLKRPEHCCLKFSFKRNSYDFCILLLLSFHDKFLSRINVFFSFSIVGKDKVDGSFHVFVADWEC